MKYPGFIGPTYAGISPQVANDRCINLFPVCVKSGAPENQYMGYSTPGCIPFARLSANPIQALYTEPSTGRMFAVAGNVLYEVYVDGSSYSYGQIDGGPYTFASNGTQVMITCATVHTGWIFTLATNVLVSITSPGFLGADSVVMIDNYFITRVPNSREFQLSALLDGLTWDALDYAVAEGGPDNLVGDMADHRELWLFGSRRIEIYVDTGAALFPFERINSVYIEHGLAATKSLSQGENTLYWLGQNQHGQCRVFAANGYIPVAVSNASVEYYFNMYALNGGISDATAFVYQDENGHTFYVISFPSASSEISATGAVVNNVVNGATWVYDVTEKLWHERAYLDPASGTFGRALSTYHAFAFGRHLVGGGDNTGNIYALSCNVYQDNYNPIKRVRRAPHIVDELKWLQYHKFRLSVDVGDFGTLGQPQQLDGSTLPTGLLLNANTFGLSELNGMYLVGASWEPMTPGHPGIGYVLPESSVVYMVCSYDGTETLFERSFDISDFTDGLPKQIVFTDPVQLQCSQNAYAFGWIVDGRLQGQANADFSTSGSFLGFQICAAEWPDPDHGTDTLILSGPPLSTSQRVMLQSFREVYTGGEHPESRPLDTGAITINGVTLSNSASPSATVDLSARKTALANLVNPNYDVWCCLPVQSPPTHPVVIVPAASQNTVTLRVSNDGGKTWSSEYEKLLGNTGEYGTVVEWRALGRAMRRTFEVATSVNGPFTLIDAYLDVTEGSR